MSAAQEEPLGWDTETLNGKMKPTAWAPTVRTTLDFRKDLGMEKE